jgi:isoleucyl-tRNA synthetase
MKGWQVPRKAGWDTHGLPVELEVEKLLNINGKPEIERYGVEPFIKKCKESVWKYENEWRKMSERVGFWADMDDPYVTYHNSYIESVWWALKTIWDKGLLYKGHKVVPYCPRCGTALSSHEVSQGYQNVRETSVFVKFKAADAENRYFLVWTTTPWTLPSNVALCVNADKDYARVRCGDEEYILAEALLDSVLDTREAGYSGYEKLETFKGAALEGLAYEPLHSRGQNFRFDAPAEGAFYVCCDNYVTLTDGTGIVHIAPAFGEDDARVGLKYGLPFVQLVDEQGRFAESVTPWSGMFVKDADPHIVKALNMDGKLYKKIQHEHSYPFCWRCDTPLLYYARDTWFIKMSALRDKLMEYNNTVNWLPDNVRTGRFGNFLENVIDWGLSRERYWGTPLPIWECGCGYTHCVGSVAELREMSGAPADIELHKPYIDQVRLRCPDCGKEMKRVPEVIDCWFDSGAMPFAQWHYPFENKEWFEERFPADFISEAMDQTRGWFYSLMAISALLFDKSPYKNVVVLGHVLDKDGLKMSKHIGNTVEPMEAMEEYGADAVRWYFIVNSAPWLPNRFYGEAVKEVSRKFLGTLWNTYAFYVLYANIDQFNPAEHQLGADLAVMDRWILSRLHTLIKEVDSGLASYKLTEPARALNGFVDELSNWYVRRGRGRFWGNGMQQDKINAYMTLYTVLAAVAKLAAPFVPFISEAVYRNLVAKQDSLAPESVHLCDYPEVCEAYIDPELECGMDTVLAIVAAGRAARNSAGIKNRQPVAELLVAGGRLSPSQLRTYTDIVADELNVKEVRFVDDVENLALYKFKPQLKTLGKRYGKLLPEIGRILAESDGRELMAELKRAGELVFEVDGKEVRLSESDLLVETARLEGWALETSGKITAALNTKLTDELIEEGFVRELISKIQSMRKEADFDVCGRITVYYYGSDLIEKIFKKFCFTIKSEVLADDIIIADTKEQYWDRFRGQNRFRRGEGLRKEWDVNGEAVVLVVLKQ